MFYTSIVTVLLLASAYIAQANDQFVIAHNACNRESSQELFLIPKEEFNLSFAVDSIRISDDGNYLLIPCDCIPFINNFSFNNIFYRIYSIEKEISLVEDEKIYQPKHFPGVPKDSYYSFPRNDLFQRDYYVTCSDDLTTFLYHPTNAYMHQPPLPKQLVVYNVFNHLVKEYESNSGILTDEELWGVTPDGKQIVSMISNHNDFLSQSQNHDVIFRFRSVETDEILHQYIFKKQYFPFDTLGISQKIHFIIAPDDSLIIFSQRNPRRWDKIVVYDRKMEFELFSLPFHVPNEKGTDSAPPILFDRDNNFFVQESYFQIRHYDMKTGKVMQTYNPHELDSRYNHYFIKHFELSSKDVLTGFLNIVENYSHNNYPDSAYAVDWEIKTGKVINKYNSFEDFEHRDRISPDGRTILCLDRFESETDAETEQWKETKTTRQLTFKDAKTGEILATQEVPANGRIMPVEISNDWSKMVGYGREQLIVYDISSIINRP